MTGFYENHATTKKLDFLPSPQFLADFNNDAVKHLTGEFQMFYSVIILSATNTFSRSDKSVMIFVASTSSKDKAYM